MCAQWYQHSVSNLRLHKLLVAIKVPGKVGIWKRNLRGVGCWYLAPLSDVSCRELKETLDKVWNANTRFGGSSVVQKNIGWKWLVWYDFD